MQHESRVPEPAALGNSIETKTEIAYSRAVSERQLRLFPRAKILEERFGRSFFLSLPKSPGVYLMADENNRLIYVGKAKNLRQRLNSYRFISPESGSRKSVRLVCSVARISVELCETEQAALLKENELLRRHRPKFNRVNTYPPAYNFYRVSRDGETLQLARGTELIESEQTFGAFKSGARCFGPLLRSIWAVLNQPVSAHSFPSPPSRSMLSNSMNQASCSISSCKIREAMS